MPELIKRNELFCRDYSSIVLTVLTVVEKGANASSHDYYTK